MELKPQNSYRSLLILPSVGRLLIGMQIARIGQSMLGVTIVLFALTTYHSPMLAGVATFFSIVPGLIVSPVAGALLDRHGRTRLVMIDYLVAMGSLVLMGVLASGNALPSWLLIVIASIASVTTPLSGTGLRSLFPIIVPSHLWERINAIDSAGFVIAAVIGPPLAAALVSLNGGASTLIVVGFSFGIAAIVIARTPDPAASSVAAGPLLRDAWQGLIYTWRNPTLRGLGFSISVLNLAGGALNIIVPLVVLERLNLQTIVVGLVFAIQGLTGVISAFIFGRMDTRNRERMMLALPMIANAIALALLLAKPNFHMLIVVMSVIGFLNGPIDVALFTLRQRRTGSEWRGRAFAVSMAFNYLGSPVGAAIAGAVAARSIGVALTFSVGACLISGVLAWVMIPSTSHRDC